MFSFRRGTRAPPYRAQTVSGRAESSAPTAGQGAARNGTSGTPSPTGGSPYPSVGRDLCVPPHGMHVFLSAGHAGPALQSTDRIRAGRVVHPYSRSRSRAKRDVGDAVPYERSPYPSVGRDPCVPPHDMHVFLPAGHAGPALQGTGRIRADRVVRPYDGVPCVRQADATKSRRARRAFTSWDACALISLYLPPDMCWRRGSGRRSCSRPCRGRGAG